MNSISTHELLVKIQSGNLNAVGVLFAQSAGAFYRCARGKYTLSCEDADDVVQTTFKKLLESIGKYDSERAGGSRWMWRIFRNAVVDILRRKPTEELTADLIENVLHDEANDCNPVEYTEEQELQEIARRAFQQLSEADRQELLRDHGKRGPKPASLRLAQERLRAVFFEIYEAH